MNNQINETNALRYAIRQLRKAYERKDKDGVLDILSEAKAIDLEIAESETVKEWEALVEETGNLFKS